MNNFWTNSWLGLTLVNCDLNSVHMSVNLCISFGLISKAHIIQPWLCGIFLVHRRYTQVCVYVWKPNMLILLLAIISQTQGTQFSSVKKSVDERGAPSLKNSLTYGLYWEKTVCGISHPTDPLSLLLLLLLLYRCNKQRVSTGAQTETSQGNPRGFFSSRYVQYQAPLKNVTAE